MKNFKTFYNAQTASRFKKTKQPLPDKSFLRLWKKNSYGDLQEYTEICLNNEIWEMSKCWRSPHSIKA